MRAAVRFGSVTVMKSLAVPGGVLVLCGIAGLVVACATATGSVTGGEPIFDASPPVATAEPDGGGSNCIIGDDAGSGTTWTDLYRDFFGPKAAASCAGDGACHGDANQQGSKSSDGFVCGADKAACRQTMLDTKLVNVPSDQASPENSGLVVEIRKVKADGKLDGLMPLRPACVAFEPAAVDRITTWIKNGAPDD